jgi:hypothetical protein
MLSLRPILGRLATLGFAVAGGYLVSRAWAEAA